MPVCTGAIPEPTTTTFMASSLTTEPVDAQHVLSEATSAPPEMQQEAEQVDRQSSMSPDLTCSQDPVPNLD